MKTLLNKTRAYLKKHSVRKSFRTAVSVMSCIVVFVTTYALLLPGLTLEANANCGKEEHEHTEGCFTAVLICGQEESEGHKHSETCYNEAGELICGLEESEGHRHTDACYEQQLTCGKEVHIHDASCYPAPEPEPEPVNEEPAYEEPANEEPAYEEPANDEPAYEEPAYEEPAYEEPDYEEPAYEEPANEAPANQASDDAEDEHGEPAHAEPANDKKAQEEDSTAASSTLVMQDATTDPAAQAQLAEVLPDQKLAEIDFGDYLTGETDIYYVPEGGDRWEPVGGAKLDPAQKVLLHIGYRLPEGTINSTNAEAEYAFPIDVKMTEDEVDENNSRYGVLIEGTDREAANLMAAGSYEIRDKRDSQGNTYDRVMVITWNAGTCRTNYGAVLADGSVMAQPKAVEGFLEVLVRAADLLTLTEDGGETYILHWNGYRESEVHFDEEKLAAYLTGSLAEENAAPAEAEEKAETEAEAAENSTGTVFIQDHWDEKEPQDQEQDTPETAAEEAAAEENEETSAEEKEETPAGETPAEENKEPGFAAGTMTVKGNDYRVHATFDESAKLPEGTKLVVTEIGGSQYKELLNESKGAVGSGKEVVGARFFDITFVGPDGNEIEPAAMVDIKIDYRKAETVDGSTSVEGLHFTQDGAQKISVETEAGGENRVSGISFKSDSFSVYGILYTVEFTTSANGETYEYVITGGSAVSLRELVQALGIAADDAGTEEDELNRFMDHVEMVRVSAPDLLNAVQVNTMTTVGSLKASLGIESVYSAELTQEQIREIEDMVIEAGDWALISKKPFETKERLTVIMKDGGKFYIDMTDAVIDPEEYDQTIYTYTVNNTNGGYINLVNSAGQPSGQDNTGTTVYDGVNKETDATAAARYAQPVANPGWRFVNWTNGGRIYDKGTATIRPTRKDLMDGLYKTDTFTANFVQANDFMITLQATEGGRIKDDLTTISYNEIIQHSPDILAIPDAGYRSLGWKNQDGEFVTLDRFLYSSDIERADGVYTAVFELIEDVNIYYRANGTYGTVSTEHEVVHLGDDPIGSVATPKEGYQFISWVNDEGETVWPLEEFEPFADLIYEGATYTAVFESAAYSSYFMIQADDTNHGYIESPQYENSVNGRIVSMYIRDDGTIPQQLKAVAYEDYLFDHWEVNGVEIEDMGDTIPAGYDFSGFELRDGWNILMAYYKDNPVKLPHTIVYKANQGGSVRGLAGTRNEQGYYVDNWMGSDTTPVMGASAAANSDWTFTGWLEEVEEGVYVVASNDSTFVPAGKGLKDTTYYAAFRINQSQKGMVGYNMNIIDVPVRWTGKQELVIASAAGAPMYYDTNGGNYYARGQRWSIDTHIPEAEGYYFVGWYNKDRSKWTSTNSGSDNGNCPVGQGGHPKTEGSIIPRGSDTDIDGLRYNNIVFPMAGNGSRYTFEAMFAGIDAASARLPYDGEPHELKGEAVFFKGTVTETERYRQQLDALKERGAYSMGPVHYQLLDEDGNPVGEPTDSFERTLPGIYKVRVYADGSFAGQDFHLTKDVTLEIYAARIIIKKYWKEDSHTLRPADLETTMYKYDTKHKGVVKNPDTNSANREAAKAKAVEVTASELSGFEKEEPEWEKHGSVWTKTYEDVLVRGSGYSETDQASGYDLFFADETVPEGYELTSTDWVRSEDKLTTTIVFRNEYEHQPLTLKATKQWVGEAVQEKHPAVTFYLMRSVNGDPFVKVEGSEQTIPADAAGEALTVTWTDLPQMSEDRVDHYTYKIAEVELEGFTTEITGSAADGYIVTNTDARIEIPVLKVDAGSEETVLEGAEFTLYKYKDGVAQKYITPLFPQSPYAEEKDVVFTSGADGKLKIAGLTDGTYELDETKAPEGYIKKGDKVKFTIVKGKVVLTGGADNAVYKKIHADDAAETLVIKNERGAKLPATGGKGTMYYIYIGTLMALGSGIMLLYKRRQEKLAKRRKD